MEKIYMEESKKQKNSLFNFSVVLSFVVAIIGVFSIGLFGIVTSQKNGLISYAAPLTSDTFNFVKADAPLGKITSSNSSGGSIFSVPKYYADAAKTIPVFCVEYQADTENGATYTKGSVIDDYGLLYLLNHTSANSGVTVTDYDNSSLETYITQVSIWMYLYETDPTATQSTSKNYIVPEDVETIKNAVKLIKFNADRSESVEVYKGQNLYTAFIKPLVDKAKTASDVAILNVSKASDEISMSEDKKFYFSALITVTGDPSSALKNYAISLNGIEGAKAVDEDGNELTGTVTPGTKFYVRIPAEKVTKNVQKVVVSVDGKFDTLEGKYYNAAGDFQRVVSVKTGEKTISKGTEVEFVGTDDTGMNTVQTIYFIGLIVLLCGVGIVYANAKPVQVKQ